MSGLSRPMAVSPCLYEGCLKLIFYTNSVNEIYVWERDSGELKKTLFSTHHLPGPQGGIVAVACPVVTETAPMTIVSATSKGNILIWESIQPEEETDATHRASTM